MNACFHDVADQTLSVAAMTDDYFSGFQSEGVGSEWRDLGDTPSRRQRTTRAGVYDEPFMTHAVDPYVLCVWILRVDHTGGATLKLNQEVVATLTPREGAAILNTEGCPFDRAGNIIALLSSQLAVVLYEKVCADFEFELARWIPKYFDL